MFKKVRNNAHLLRIGKGARRLLSLLLTSVMLLTMIPIADVFAVAVAQLSTVDLPVYLGASTGISDYMKVYVMNDPETGNPVYCTKKGSSLPTGGYALEQADVNNSQLLFYRLNYIYSNGRSATTGAFTRTTPNNNGIDYSAASTYFGYITNQIAIWMVLGQMGYQVDNLVGGTYGGYNIYTASLNGTMKTMGDSEYATEWTASQSIPNSVARAARQSYLNDLHNAYTLLVSARGVADAAMAQVGYYTSDTVTCTAGLVNKTAYTYNAGTGLYTATVAAIVSNGGTWTIPLATNCTASPNSGVDGQTITITATQAQMNAGASIRVRAIVPDPASIPKVVSLFTSNGQSFLDLAPILYTADAIPAATDFDPLTGHISIYKQSDRGFLVAEPGAVFQVYSVSPPALVQVLTTNSSGNTTTAALPYGQYNIHQASSPTGLFLAADQLVTIDGSNPEPHITVTNLPGNGQIQVNKTTNRAGTFAAEPGAVFQIYLDSAGSYAAANAVERDEITTNAAGYAISKVLPYGLYSMVQTVAPIGTVLNGATWQFWVGQDGAGTTVTGDLDTANIDNGSTTGYLQINKTSTRGTAVPEAGATFEVYLTAAGSYAAASTAERDQITTNAAGTATTKALLYGAYTVHQTGMPVGTKAAADFSVTIGAVNGETIVASVTNQVYWGLVTIDKSLSYAGVTSDEAGAVFQVYNSAYASFAAAPASEKDELTTDAVGAASSKSLPYGTYTIRQTVAPVGAQLNTATWTVLIGADGATFIDNDVDTQAITDLPTLNQLEIMKTTARTTNIAEAGAQFQVWNTNYASYAAAPAAYRDILITDATGYDISVMLPYGTYTVHQTVVPAGTKATADLTVALTSANGTVIHRDLVNTTYWGQAEINKTTAYAGSVKEEASAVFQVYLTSAGSYVAAAAGERDQITTDASGHAVTKPLPYGSYTAVQVSAPVGAQINLGSWTFMIGLDGATYVDNDVDTQNIIDNPTFGKLELSKTTNRGYIIPEAGATFEVYSTDYASFAAAPIEYKDTITTSATGNAITKDLPYGNYLVHQSVAPAGTIAVADFSVTIGETNGETVQRDLVNETYWGDIQVLKYKSAPSSTTGVLTPEADATFRIYPSAYSTWSAALAALTPAQETVLMDEITSDMGGVALTNHQLPYGEYTVEQIDTIANLYTFKVDAWQVFIGAVDDQTYTYVRNNEIYEQYLAVIKTDAETGQVIKMAGATFQILAADGKTILADTNGVSSFVTDANGRIDIKDLALQVGSYFIKETKAPKGYALNSDLKAFAVSIADHGSSIVTIDYGVDIRSELFSDTAQTCQLIVEKKGDVLTSAALIDAVNPDTGARYADEAGKALSIYQFGYSLTGKAGAVFEVFVGVKDIGDNVGLLKKYDKDGDGVKETELIAGTSLGQITTKAVLQKDGTTKFLASLAGLPLDAVTGTAQYVLKEIKAPAGDLINPKTLTYDFTFADQTITQIDQEQSITDTRQKVQITVAKQKEAGTWNNSTKSFDWPLVAAPEILFGLYTAKNTLAPDGSVLVAADTLVDVLYTDAKGVGHTLQDLPMGSYYAKELNVTPDVVYDSITKYPVTTVPTADQTVPTAIFALNSGKPIINRQIAGTMEIYKYAEDTNLPMPGVVFEVYDLTGNLVDTVTTAADGTTKTSVLPYARYTLVETKTITGYALAERTSFSIWIMPKEGETYSTSQMTIVDKKMAQIEVYKLTGDGTTTPMDGVVFGVYEAKSDVLVTSLTTDKAGYGMVYVPKGSYYMMELHTWDGFALMPGRIAVSADWAVVYTYHQTNSKTAVTLSKLDVNTNAGVSGAVITVNDSTGKEVSRTVTDEKGETKINGLPAGTYTFIETIAPTGYVINTSTFTFSIDAYGKCTGQTSIADSPTSLTIKKTSTVSDTGLGGTQFSITDAVTMKMVNVVWSATLKAYIPANATVLGAVRENSSLTTLTTGADGTATVLYLPVSTYIVTEIKAPEGFNLDSDPTNVNVNSSSTGVLGASVTIRNSPIIPKTGETNTIEYIIPGVLLLALSGAVSILLIHKTQNRKKKDEMQK